MKVGIPTEKAEGEKRVALVPEVAKSLKDKGHSLFLQSGAGAAAGFRDGDYEAAGVTIINDLAALLAESEIVLKVMGPADGGEKLSLREGQILVSFISPLANPGTVKTFLDQKATTFAMELIPRITRAQSMDALSSMSTIAGYKASLMAADRLPKFFPMLMTAAGTLPPAKVLVIGAGVAGLQAIATCKRLGAIVEAFDVRPAVKEQVESLGARFVALQAELADAEDAGGYAKEISADTHQKELDLLASRLTKNDIVITTALIPNKPAPILITKEMVKLMANGSVIVDLAAPAGGNCEATVPGQNVVVDGVQILGPTNLLSEMAMDASRMYSRNIAEFLFNLAPEGNLNMDMEDPIIRDTLVTHEGRITHEQTRLAMEQGGSSS